MFRLGFTSCRHSGCFSPHVDVFLDTRSQGLHTHIIQVILYLHRVLNLILTPSSLHIYTY